MKSFRRLVSVLGVCTALLAISPRANADISLFPEEPVRNILMADSGEYQTGIKFPDSLDENILQKPIPEVWKEYAPYITLSSSLPLFSLDLTTDNPQDFKIFVQHVPEDKVKREIKRIHEGKDITDKILSLSFVGSGLLNFPKNSDYMGVTQKTINNSEGNLMEYKGKLEAFLTSPMINEYFSDGNRLYLAGGLEARGLVNLNEIKSISSFGNFPPDKYRLFGGVYIIANSPWSEQFVIIQAGLDNSLDKNEKNFHFSTTFEFPSIFYEEKGLKDFKLSPYASFYAKVPIIGEKVTTGALEAGVKLSGKTDRAVVMYGRADFINGFASFSAGAKLGL